MKLPIALVLWILSPGVAFAGTALNVEVSGGVTILVIDADGDGPDADDCTLTATFDDPDIIATWTQNNTPLIRGCSGMAPGTLFVGQDESSDFLYVTAETASGPNGTIPPLILPMNFALDAYEEFDSGSPDGFPAALNTVEIEIPPGQEILTAQLCDDDGPTLLVQGALIDDAKVRFYPDANNPTHVAAHDIPFQLAPSEGGTVVNRNLYVPMVGTRVTVGIEGQTPLLADVDFADLDPCARAAAAPATSLWGLSLAAGALLAAGLRIRRRRARQRAA